MDNNLIVGIGEVLWDILPEGKKIGGAPANFAYHVSQFGLPGCIVSAVGNDTLGTEIIDTFTAKGLDQLIAQVSYPTGTVQVHIDPAGIPQYQITEDVAWDNIPYTHALEQLARHTKAVCFGSLAQRSSVSRTTINRFFDAIPRDNDSLIVFDVNLRQDYYTEDILSDSMLRSDILKLNDEELIILTTMFDIPDRTPLDRCRILLDRFKLKIIILTCGIEGSYVITPGHTSFQPTPQVQVADTVGAGDSFTASFVANILKGNTVDQAHLNAVRTSAFVCTQPGATPILPTTLTT